MAGSELKLRTGREDSGQTRSLSRHALLLAIARFLLLGTIFLGLTASRAQTVALELINGDRITGTIVSEDATRVVLTNRWVSELIVPTSEIKKRETIAPSAAPATPADAAPLPTPPPSLKPPPSPPVKAKGPKRWAGDIQLGVDLGFSEKNRQLYTGRSKVTYGRGPFRSIFDYNFAYGLTEGVLSANRMDGFIKTDYDVHKRFFVYNLAGAGYDEVRKTDIRYEAGPGVGYHWVTLSNFVFNTEFGAHYQVYEYSEGAASREFRFRLAEDLTWQISDRLTLDEKFAFFPVVENPENYRIRFETNLRFWLRKNLSLNLTVLDEYDTDPARSVNPNDLQVRSSVGVKF